MAYYTQEQGLISQRRGSSSYFYHYDGLGSTKALTDVNQNTQASYIYDAWGNILQTNGTVVNPYLYVGELGYYADGNAGMYLLTQRWYNPVVGRFVVRDPKGMVEKHYSYCLDNPLNLVDPLGEEEKSNDPYKAQRDHCYKQCERGGKICTASCTLCFGKDTIAKCLAVCSIAEVWCEWERDKKYPPPGASLMPLFPPIKPPAPQPIVCEPWIDVDPGGDTIIGCQIVISF